MKYDLQFFADDIDTDVDSTGAEEPEYADQVETVNEEVNETSEESTPGADSPSTENTDIDRNAIYANARRRAEAEVRKRQAEEDARFAERFKGLTNPETHQPITTTAEYFEALDAQERLRQQAELQSKGVDPAMIENLINNSPRMREADRLIRDMKQQEVYRQIESDVAELNKLDSSINSLEDVPVDIVEYATKRNMTILEAYKVLNYGNVNTQNAAAIQQRTINQINGKSHLAPVNGVAKQSDLVECPPEQLAKLREFYPDASEAELTKKYNRVLKASK